MQTWLAANYGDATPERVLDVLTQLDAVVTPAGTPDNNGRIARCTPAELDAFCAEMVTATGNAKMRKPDRAIVVLLQKAADRAEKGIMPIGTVVDAHGDTPSEAEARREREAREAADREAAVARKLAQAWRREHPTEYAAIERRVNAEYRVTADRPVEALTRVEQMAREAVLVSECVKRARNGHRSADAETSRAPPVAALR